MRSRCAICGKGTAFGHNVSHSHRKTNRRWLPNIQRRALSLTVIVARSTPALAACERSVSRAPDLGSLREH